MSGTAMTLRCVFSKPIDCRTDPRAATNTLATEMSTTHASNTSTDVVVRRIYNEFMEMPGLRVTCQQAQRLWGLDRQTCLEVLE